MSKDRLAAEPTPVKTPGERGGSIGGRGCAAAVTAVTTLCLSVGYPMGICPTLRDENLCVYVCACACVCVCVCVCVCLSYMRVFCLNSGHRPTETTPAQSGLPRVGCTAPQPPLLLPSPITTQSHTRSHSGQDYPTGWYLMARHMGFTAWWKKWFTVGEESGESGESGESRGVGVGVGKARP